MNIKNLIRVINGLYQSNKKEEERPRAEDVSMTGFIVGMVILGLGLLYIMGGNVVWDWLPR